MWQCCEMNLVDGSEDSSNHTILANGAGHIVFKLSTPCFNEF